MATSPRLVGPVTEHCLEDTDLGSSARETSGRGYAEARRVLESLDADGVRALVAESGLRARGRWGDSVADEWQRLGPTDEAERSVVCHAGLAEPGLAADRLLIECAPHLVLEGLLVAARALGATNVRLCVASSDEAGAAAADRALDAARANGLVGEDAFGTGERVDVQIARLGPFAPCGAATALIEVLAGRPARPRPRPPGPPSWLLDGRSAWVVDAETCAHLALIARHGAEWFREQGDEACPGTLVFEVVGAVERPGLYELPLGTRLGTLLFEHAGGVARGRKVGAVLPGGIASAALSPGQLDVALLDDALRARGSALGRGQVVVLDDRTCMVAVADEIAGRFRALACGHAVHCRDGAPWIHELVARIGHGGAEARDLPLLLDLCDEVESDDHCGLAGGVGRPVRSLLGLFRADFEAHVRGDGCGRDRAVTLG